MESNYNISDDVLSKLQRDVSDIKVAILGNEYNPEGGVLCRTQRNEAEIASLKSEIAKQNSRFNRVVWTGIGVGSGAGFVWYILTEVLTKILG